MVNETLTFGLASYILSISLTGRLNYGRVVWFSVGFFSNGTQATKQHLIKPPRSIELFNYSLEKGLIRICDYNTYGEELYTITDEGKRVRDN